jgi:ApaG protein
MGKMRGTYLMERLANGQQFQVDVPEFTLMVPFRSESNEPSCWLGH